VTTRKCWAQSLGNCSTSLSAEHIVSAGLFTTEKVSVQGFKWCLDEAKTVGLSSLVRNILCTTHNNLLSQVDEAAIKASKVIQECIRLNIVRGAMKERIWNFVRLKIEGEPLERWFLKTLINASLTDQERIGSKTAPLGEVPVNFVQIAFGVRKFRPNAGLYFAGEVGEHLTFAEAFRIVPFYDKHNSCVMGGTFHFYGLRFMLYLGEEGLAEKFNFIQKTGGLSEHPRPL
jgi:hypothetical protein